MAGIPSNIVIIWSGAILDIPEGWFLCDGDNGTPDLRNRFVYGVSGTVNLSTTGGSADAIVVSHNHTGTANTTGAHTHGIGLSNFSDQQAGFRATNSAQVNQTPTSTSAGAHSHTLTLTETGSSGTNANLPPYHALAYIMYGGE
jgi:hypothetical protein